MVDIKNTELVFCDYSKAIEFAWGKGLSKKATILTQSPFLCLNNLYNTKSFNSYFKGSLPYFGKYVKEVCLDIEEKILKDKKNCFFRHSIYIALHDLTNLFARLSIFKNNDLKKKILIINIDTGNEDYNNIINTNFEKVFSKEINYKIITYTLDKKEKEKVDKKFFFLNTKNSLFRFLDFFLSFKFLNPINLIYYFWKYTKFNSPKGNFIYVYDNPMIQDVVKHLVLKGFGVKRIKDPKILKLNKKKTFKEIDTLLESIRPIISKFITGNFCSKLHCGIERYVNERIRYYLNQNIIGTMWWDNEIKKISKKKPHAILTNIASYPTGKALYSACLNNKIPLFKFQHGVCIEFSKTNHNRDHISEASDSDIVFCYNKNYFDLDKKNKFSISKKIPVGMPNCYWDKPKRLSVFKKTPSFFYINTVVYSGNRRFIENQTDDFLALNEITFIRKVLSKIKYKVLYKCYPQLPSYLDEDLIKKEINKSKNFFLYEKNKNLNEISLTAKVLITSRATSTLSFCIMQNKPIVFIDWPNSKPLRKIALKHLKKYLFYFNAGDKDFLEKLKKFLNKGPELIEKEFRLKKKKYQKTAYNYIQTGGKSTGSRIVKIIEDHLFTKELN